jgi:hypothetical protein
MSTSLVEHNRQPAGNAERGGHINSRGVTFAAPLDQQRHADAIVP